MTVSFLLRFYSRTRDDTYLAGALGAAVHRPLIFVLVHNAVVDADSALAVHSIFQQHAFLRLWRREGERERKKRVDRGERWKTFTLPTFQYK